MYLYIGDMPVKITPFSFWDSWVSVSLACKFSIATINYAHTLIWNLSVVLSCHDLDDWLRDFVVLPPFHISCS
jgi:hypothetical protein